MEYYARLYESIRTKYVPCHQISVFTWECGPKLRSREEAFDYCHDVYQSILVVHSVNNIWPDPVKRLILQHKMRRQVKVTLEEARKG